MSEKNLLIYGRNPVREALLADKVINVILSENFSDLSLIEELKEKNIPFIYKKNNDLKGICHSEDHQGIIAYIKPYEYSSLEEIIAYSKAKEHPLILMLDEINDPHNFGAIIRNAEAFNVDGIIIKKASQIGVNGTVMKVSAGALNYVKISQVSNLTNAIKILKDNGYWILSSSDSATTDYDKLDYNVPLVLVIGSEGFGVSHLVQQNSDYVVKIPMLGHVNSLNASVASGILLSEIRSLQK
ncbi:MAG: 23S rRNA (guanosine(2251)-2'-O)-methyltransferase RlmB [Coprobacillus sp.]|nr:23S rRNA (guanosine(2251)-2'-O)-methyltransferase RlmB [Coprobacillus sp.]